MPAVRFLHAASVDASVDVYNGSEALAFNLDFGDLTAFLPLECSRLYLKVKVAGSEDVLLKEKIKLHHGLSTVSLIWVNDQLQAHVSSNRMCDLGYGHYKLNFVNLVQESVSMSLNGDRIFSDVSFGKRQSETLKLNGSPFSVAQIATSSGQILVENVSLNSKAVITLYVMRDPDGKLDLVVGNDNGKDVYTLDRLQDDFNANLYKGQWYQIADIPQFYETDCPRATAQYTLLEDAIKVVNLCANEAGKVTQIARGEATASDPRYPQVLTVQIESVDFVGGAPGGPPGPPGGIPIPIEAVGPNYLIHETDYCSYALIGSMNRSSLYILSRHSQMCYRLYKKLLRKSECLGYNVELVKLNYDTLK